MDRAAVTARVLRVAYLLAVLAIGAWGVDLRLHHLDTFPARNQTADEYAWTWAGMTTWTEGQPRSWSWLDAYGNAPVTHWKGHNYRLVKPWLDHPPLFALLQGGWMVLRGYKVIEEVDLHVMREMSVILFGVTFLLLWRLSRSLVGKLGALLALLVYATSPPAVFNSRLVVSENLVTPLMLAGHLALLHWRAVRAPRWLVLMGLCAMLMPLTKLPAVCTCFALVALAWHLEEVKAAVAMSVGTLLGIAGFYAWSMALGGDLIFKVMDSHKDKFQGFNGAAKFYLDPNVVNQGMTYLPFILALALTAHALLKEKADGTVHAAIPMIAYPLTMTFLVVQVQVFGWYLLPLYPYCALLLGAFWARALKGEERGGLWLAGFLLMPSLAGRSIEFKWWELKAMRVRYALVALALPVLARAQGVLAGRLEPVAAGLLLLWQVMVDVEIILAR